MRVLINHSNHPSIKWDDRQKEDWDKIIDIPFPTVSPCADTDEVYNLAKGNFGKILWEWEIAKREGYEPYIYVAGEYTYCYIMYDLLRLYLSPLKLAIPTTARMVIERTKEDGTTEKVSVFEFVRWRVISP